MFLSDTQIHALCNQAVPMIQNYCPLQMRQNAYGSVALSFGLSYFGYDLRLSADGMKVFKTSLPDMIIDPKNFDATQCLEDLPLQKNDSGHFYLLPPLSYALALSTEYFNIPNNIIGLCTGKSTYARSGLIINFTPLEPGWSGRLVLEFYNATPMAMMLYVNEGLAQVMFAEGETPSKSYAETSGKYQHQREIVTAKV